MALDVEKKAALQKKAADRQVARDEKLQALSDQALELEDKYASTGQERGVDFDVFTALVGNFVVRKPEFLVAKKFGAADDKTPEDVIHFVCASLLFPEQMEARQIFQDHAGVAWRLAACLMRLYEADAEIKAKK